MLGVNGARAQMVGQSVRPVRVAMAGGKARGMPVPFAG